MKAPIDVSSIKRLYANIQIPVTCAHCGATAVIDLRETPLYYPKNGEHELDFMCWDCDAPEQLISITISAYVEVTW